MADEICAHSGRPVVRMRTADDCMTCCLAMLAGRDHAEVVAAACRARPDFSPGGPMTHAMQRRLASQWGIVLCSSLYMVWQAPGIIGVVSPTIPDCGHAVFWDGTRVIDPQPGGTVDWDYVQRRSIEFTQRAGDLGPLLRHDRMVPAAGETCLREWW
jgi:hypothetical protein